MTDTFLNVLGCPLGSHHLGSRPLSFSSSPKSHIFIVVHPVPSLVSLGSSWVMVVLTASLLFSLAQTVKLDNVF